jgi:hypothetical protein
MSVMGGLFGNRKRKPIGTVRWPGYVAELWGPNQWVVYRDGVPDLVMKRNITAIYSHRLVYRGPSHGAYGGLILRDLAEMMRGRFTFSEPAPIPKDAVS